MGSKLDAMKAAVKSKPAAKPRMPEPPKVPPVATAEKPNNRLPHGSKFDAAYTAVTETDGYWDCTLTVIVGGVAEKWQTRVNGIMASFPRLDRMYRKWLKAKAP